MKVRVSTIAAAVVFWMASGTQSAWAVSCDATDDDALQAERVIIEVADARASIMGRIDAMSQTIQENLRKQTAQLSLYTKSLGKLQTSLAQSNQRQAAQLERDSQEVEVARQLAPQRPYCEAVTGLAGLSATETGSRDALERSMVNTVNVLTQFNGAGATGTAPYARYRFEKLAELKEQGCLEAGKIWEVSENGEAQCVDDADINPFSLLGKLTYDNELIVKVSQMFAENLINPTVEDPVLYENVETEGDRLAFLEKRSEYSRKAMAYYTLMRARANKMETVSLGEYATALLPEELARGENLSKDDLYKVIASDYFRRPNYFTSLQGLSPENKKLEMLRNGAVDLMFQYEAYQQAELTNILLATLLADQMDGRKSQNYITTTAGN